MKKILSKRELRKKQTLLKHKEKRKIERAINKSKKEAYKEWVKAVKERDDYTCQICKQKFESPNAIQAAHILSKENYKSLKLDIMNGITLCFRDHKNSRLSSHLDGFAFTFWLEKNKPEQYLYLKEYLRYNGY